MRKNPSTKKAALEAAEKIIDEKPISLKQYESFKAIEEADDSAIKPLIDKKLERRLAQIRIMAREKHPCPQVLRALAAISRKLRRIQKNKKRIIKKNK